MLGDFQKGNSRDQKADRDDEKRTLGTLGIPSDSQTGTIQGIPNVGIPKIDRWGPYGSIGTKGGWNYYVFVVGAVRECKEWSDRTDLKGGICFP